MNDPLIEFAKAYQAELLNQATISHDTYRLPALNAVLRDRILTRLGDTLIDLGYYVKRKTVYEEFNPCVDCAQS